MRVQSLTLTEIAG